MDSVKAHTQQSWGSGGFNENHMGVVPWAFRVAAVLHRFSCRLTLPSSCSVGRTACLATRMDSCGWRAAPTHNRQCCGLDQCKLGRGGVSVFHHERRPVWLDTETSGLILKLVMAWKLYDHRWGGWHALSDPTGVTQAALVRLHRSGSYFRSCLQLLHYSPPPCQHTWTRHAAVP